ncbi:MAG: hypothetical protein H0W37_02665 [Pseudonocardiales bacterium]|nr:hypothetical protein [Pseudonocardiales bacterium]
MGACAGALTITLLAVLAGSLVQAVTSPAVAVGLLGALAVFVLVGEFGAHRWLLPHRPAQVPSTVVDQGPDLGALRFGYEMGTGMRTHMPSNLPYLAVASLVLLGSWPHGLLTGLGFGLGRSWMALGRHYSQAPERWDGQWHRFEPWLRRVLALTAITALVLIILPVAARYW